MRLKRISAVAVFIALSYVCVFLIRFKVDFLTFDLKDAVMAIGSMYFGPLSALVMSGAVSLLEFLTISDTGVYGLIMNFISSAVFCTVAATIYKFRKTVAGAAVSLVIAAVTMCGVMLVANMMVTPYYMGVPTAVVRELIPTLLMPFNLTKGIFNAAVVMLLYKPFSSALKASGILRSGAPAEKTAGGLSAKTRVIVVIVSAAVIAASLAVLFVKLGGEMDLYRKPEAEAAEEGSADSVTTDEPVASDTEISETKTEHST